MRDLILTVGRTVDVEGSSVGSEYCGFAVGYIEMRIRDASEGGALVKRLSVGPGSQVGYAWSGESACCVRAVLVFATAAVLLITESLDRIQLTIVSHR